MKKNIKARMITLVLAVAMLVTWIPFSSTENDAASYVSTSKLNSMLQKALGTETNYVKGIKSTSKLTNEWVAKALDRAAREHDGLKAADFDFDTQVKEAFYLEGFDTENIINSVKKQFEDERYAVQIKNLVTYEEYQNILRAKTYDAVKYKKRIKGIYDIDKSNVGAVRRLFVLGIITGSKVANYSDKRDLKLRSYAKLSDIKVYIDRIVNPEKRVYVTTEGKVTRTSNLPADKDLWGYVLDSVPNWVYNYDLVNGRNFSLATSADVFNSDFIPGSVKILMNYKNAYKNYDQMVVTIKNNQDYYAEFATNFVTSVLNYSYKEDQDAWISDLENYLFFYGEDLQGENPWEEDNEAKHVELKKLTSELKKNKMVYETAWVYTDPGLIFSGGDPCVRVIAKFRYVSGKADLTKNSNWIYGGDEWKLGYDYIVGNKLDGAEYGKWMTVIVDVPLVDFDLGLGDGSDVAVEGERFVNYSFLTGKYGKYFFDNGK